MNTRINTGASAAASRSNAVPNAMKIHPKHSDWFFEFKKSEPYAMFTQGPVAYFCAEYALDFSLPTYAGGLGVLAGDFIREAALREFPLVSVGLLYQQAQSVLSLNKGDHTGKLKKVVAPDGKEAIVAVPIDGRMVYIQAWQWQEENTAVYLLDTDIPDNNPQDRLITRRLYDEDRDIRLKQEIVLGIGGFRMLARLGYHASVYHLNEGHSVFLALELVRHEMEHQRVDFESGCEYAKKHILFTNHTLVPEGQEKFSAEKVSLFLKEYAREMGLKGEDIAQLGISENNSNVFSMTTVSFRLSSKSNSVSLLHQKKSQEIWPNQITNNVTNGVFIKRWDKIGDTSEINFCRQHLENKKELLALVHKATGKVWQETDLVFVWARRLVEYKQPLLFLDDTGELLKVLGSSPVPVRIVFSGPTSEQRNPLADKVENAIKEKLSEVAAFIPNYNTEIAEILTAGGDIWLNTPQPGTEACGTSGMKAGLNGVLSLSTNDGWVHEVDPEKIGWVVNGTSRGEEDREILRQMEEKIIPLYAECLKNQENSIWLNRMKTVRKFVAENFSTSRVLREYIEKLYIPILRQKHEHKFD